MRGKVGLALVVVWMLVSLGDGGVCAATAFAQPVFADTWRMGEARIPNFWGPLATARPGQMEQYAEGALDYSEGGPYNPGQGWRLVQYFDKTRMELTHPAQGLVTNGLLAVELISGRVQLGDNTFEQRQPATIPVAGDPDNPGPTYAMLQANAAQLLNPAASQLISPVQGQPVTLALTPTGTITTYPAGASIPPAQISLYDETTRHNVPRAFAANRQSVGIDAVGWAISEPFWSNIKVAGIMQNVLIQAFERRVLTLTLSNPPPFQVEFGNIGQHYYRWRYNVSGPMNAAVSLSAITNASGANVSFTASVPTCLTTQTRLGGTTAWSPDPAATCTQGMTLQTTVTRNPGEVMEVRGAAKDATGSVIYTPNIVTLR